MPTISWLTATSGDWSNQTLWNTGTTPNTASADVVINASETAGSYTVTIDPGTSYLVNALTLDPGLPTSGIADYGILTVDGAVALENGAVALGGNLAAAHLTIGQNGALSGSGTVTVSADITDAGFIGQSAGNLTVIANSLTLAGGQLDAASGMLSIQARSFLNLAAGALTGGNYEAQDGALLMLPQNAGITALRQGDLFLLGSGTIAYFDTQTGNTQPVQAELQSIDQRSAVQIVAGASFDLQNQLTLGGQIEVVGGTLGAPAMTIASTGLLFGVGVATTSTGLVNNGTILSGTGISSSLGEAVGDLTIIGPVLGSGELVASVGTLELTTGSAEAVTLMQGASLKVDAPITPGGTLYAGPVTVSGTAQSTPATIDLPNLAEAGLTQGFSASQGGAVVTLLSDSAPVAEIDLAGSYQASDFTIADDGGGGADLIIACYVAGTRIGTEEGEVPVEALRAGDRLVTVAGEVRPVTWLGHRHLRCNRHHDPALVWPVRVRAGAFAAGVPRRDLWLSPDHAVFAEGVLIPVKHLINGASVTQVKVPAISYFHVELDRHEVILAEGLPAETYLDTGNRAMFANGAAHRALHPDFAPRAWDDACARLVTSGPEIRLVRHRLRGRARALGVSFDGELGLRVAGQTISPARSVGKRHRFLLPAGSRSAELLVAPGRRVDQVIVDGRVIASAAKLVLRPQSSVVEVVLADEQEPRPSVLLNG